MGEWGTDYILMSDFLQKRADFISDFCQINGKSISDFLQNHYLCRKCRRRYEENILFNID